ncbi:hypothetical protein BX666DRAFT_1882516 [Dichotomocladium elegans]|nr:hypothetical protein BX666DRAFT_1882516 [Dichotomocladium elegans]
MQEPMSSTKKYTSFAEGADALFDECSLIAPILQQQQQQQQDMSSCSVQDLAQLFQQQAIGPFAVDDWLASELHQSGIFTNDILSSPELPQSPPLTASPSKESTFSASPINAMLGSSSPSSLLSDGSDQHKHDRPCVPLFPDIFQAPPGPVVKQLVQPQQPQPRRLVPIMPKTEMAAAAAAAAAASNNTGSTALMGNTANLVSPTLSGHKRKAGTSDMEHDDIIQKRQRNTDAARRSRLKKLLKMEALEKRVTELEGENTRLTTRVAVLESEKSGLESKDKDLQDRIRVLEEQLAEAHKALTAKCLH